MVQYFCWVILDCVHLTETINQEQSFAHQDASCLSTPPHTLVAGPRLFSQNIKLWPRSVVNKNVKYNNMIKLQNPLCVFDERPSCFADMHCFLVHVRPDAYLRLKLSFFLALTISLDKTHEDHVKLPQGKKLYKLHKKGRNPPSLLQRSTHSIQLDQKQGVKQKAKQLHFGEMRMKSSTY